MTECLQWSVLTSKACALLARNSLKEKTTSELLPHDFRALQREGRSCAGDSPGTVVSPGISVMASPDPRGPAGTAALVTLFPNVAARGHKAPAKRFCFCCHPASQAFQKGKGRKIN